MRCGIIFVFLDSTKGGILRLGIGTKSKRGFAMTRNTTAFIFVALVAVALGTVVLSGAVRHPAPIDQAGANRSVGASPEIAELPNPALSRVRLLVSNLN